MPESSILNAMLFVNFSTEKFDDFKIKFNEVVVEHKEKGLIFLLGDLEASQGAFQYFGPSEDQAPVILVQTSDGQKYLKENVEADQIAPWLKKYTKTYTAPPPAGPSALKKDMADIEMHSKSVKVIVSGIEQRFCQQCSRKEVIFVVDISESMRGSHLRVQKMLLLQHSQSLIMETHLM
ncbi:hypothetical protein AgCh_031555 [Apium graveolens]